MHSELALGQEQGNTGSYTFPQFIINERTGQLAANLIDSGSGRVLQHIPSAALRQIAESYVTSRRNGHSDGEQNG